MTEQRSPEVDPSKVAAEPAAKVLPGETPAPEQEEWSPPSKEEWEKVIEERENYKKGLLAAKKTKEEKPAAAEFITRAEVEQMNERTAIKDMVSVHADLDANWEDVMKYYTPRNGKKTPEDIKADIQDAYDLWKIRTNGSVSTQEGKAAASLSASPALVKGLAPTIPQGKTEIKTSSDKRFAEALKSYGVDTSKL